MTKLPRLNKAGILEFVEGAAPLLHNVLIFG